MKLFFCFLLSIVLTNVHAQTKITKYYDANWIETSKEKAAFYADFIKDGSNYHCTSYWVNTHTVRGISTYTDTVMEIPVGLQVLYFKNGHVEDSSFYEDKALKYSFIYYPSNQLMAHYAISDNKKDVTSEGYDETGKPIRHYIFQKEAEFKGGQKAWIAYIRKNSSKDLTAKGDSAVTVSVQIEFIIDENGDITKPKVYKSSGYKDVDTDALQVIASGPSWINVIQFNKPVKAFRIQPIIYMLQARKK